MNKIELFAQMLRIHLIHISIITQLEESLNVVLNLIIMNTAFQCLFAYALIETSRNCMKIIPKRQHIDNFPVIRPLDIQEVDFLIEDSL